uniref:Ketoreductase domain-containing protein n=1 Tax=Tetradesmus obliquus TaxID=3088 RepID=A0A383WEJ1_TETOB|eukprot:jgi/Sobl393_1/867/SZX75529.1
MCCGLLLAVPAAVTAFIAGYFCPRQDALLHGAGQLLQLGADSLGPLAQPLGYAAAGLGWVGALVAFVTVSATGTAIALYGLMSADADLALLLRGRHKPDAFRGKVIWITGASQGIGEALAKYLAGQGARLILSSRSAERLQRVKEACLDPSAVLVLPFDLLGPEADLAAAAAAADGAFGGAGIDFLIHNAGASQHALAAETTGEVAQQLLDINTLAPIRLTQAALPHMLKRGKGRLVVTASMAAKVPSPGQAVYSAAKMAVWGYFGSLATEVADKGISVTVICPGPVGSSSDTPRVLFGPKGKISRLEQQDKRRMAPARAVQLMANAMAAGVEEAWLAKQPVLTMAYLMQYLPLLGWMVLKKVGPGRARALSSGKSGYDVSSMLREQ